MSDNQWQTNLLNVNVWLRLLFMALTSIGMAIAWYLIVFLSVVQFLLVLITGKDNDNLRNFGQGLSKWVSQSLLFLTFNSETKPYPFSEWPDIDVTEPYVAPEVEAAPVAEPEPELAAPVAAEPVDDGGEAEVQLSDDFSDELPDESASDKSSTSPAPEADVPTFTGDSNADSDVDTGESKRGDSNEKI